MRAKMWVKKIEWILARARSQDINFEKRRMIPLTDEQQKSYEKTKICVICKKKFVMPLLKKIYWKVRNYYRHTSKYRGAACSICNLKYGMPIETPAGF